MKAEVELAAELTKLLTLTVRKLSPSDLADFPSPPSITFDTNFYPGDFQNGEAFSVAVDCSAADQSTARLANAVVYFADCIAQARRALQSSLCAPRLSACRHPAL